MSVVSVTPNYTVQKTSLICLIELGAKALPHSLSAQAEARDGCATDDQVCYGNGDYSPLGLNYPEREGAKCLLPLLCSLYVILSSNLYSCKRVWLLAILRGTVKSVLTQ